MEKARITDYSFGQLIYKGVTYRKDLIILSDGSVLHPWWRQSGHHLVLADLREVLDTPVTVLVVGTGNSGMMKLNSHTLATLEKEG